MDDEEEEEKKNLRRKIDFLILDLFDMGNHATKSREQQCELEKACNDAAQLLIASLYK